MLHIRRFHVVWQLVGHIGINKAWRDGVHLNAPGGEFFGRRFHKADHACFGRRVIRLSGVANRADDGRDEHDFAGTLLEHRFRDGFGRIKHPGQVDVQHMMPIFAFHAHDQAVFGDARVIDQNIHPTELRHCLLHQRVDVVFDGDIRFHGKADAA